MIIKEKDLPGDLFVDARMRDKASVERDIETLRVNVSEIKNNIASAKVYLKAQIKNVDEREKKLADIIKSIKTTPESEERKVFYNDQLKKLNGLPLKKIKMTTGKYCGEEYRVLMAVTKPLTIAGLDETLYTETARMGMSFIKTNKKIGRYFIVVTSPASGDPNLFSFCLDTNAQYSLPCVSGGSCCFGNIGRIVNNTWKEKKIGNFLEVMIDYLTSPTYNNPYTPIANSNRQRRESEKNITTPELIAWCRGRWRVEFVELMLPLMVDFLGDDLLKVTEAQQRARLSDRGDWVFENAERSLLDRHFLPPTTPVPEPPPQHREIFFDEADLITASVTSTTF